jgi:pSer/pThr/pTyr-binding forkhead associated (FHA) protein
MITFEIYKDDKVARVLTFKSEPRPLSATAIKIGRVASADLRFEHDDQVARMHAVIDVTYEGILLVDLGSPLGTRVNGVKVRRIQLRPGDVIEVGRQRIKISFDVPADNVATKTPTKADDDGAN